MQIVCVEREGLTILASNLRLRNDQLAGITVVGASQRMLQNTDSSQDMAGNPGLVGEVRWVTQNHLGLGLKVHLLGTILHGGLDTRDLVAIVLQLVHGGVQHISASVDGGQTSKALGKFTKTVQGVDVRGLSVSSNRVTVQSDALDSLGGLAGGGDVVVSEEQGHGVTNKVLGGGLEAKLVIDVLHCAGIHIKSFATTS